MGILLDYLVYGLLIWGLAALLNKTAFRNKPASKGVAWVLAALMFFINVVALAVAKAIRFQQLSESVGLQISPKTPLDLASAFFLALLFYSLLNKKNPELTKKSGDATTHAGEARPDRNTSVYKVPQPPELPRAHVFTTSTTLHKDSGVGGPTADRDDRRASATPTPPDEASFDERRAFAVIAAELAGGGRDEGLWLKCLVECQEGGERQRILYTKYRLSELRALHDEEVAAAVAVREAADAERNTALEQARFAHLREVAPEFLRSPKRRCPNCKSILFAANPAECPHCSAVLGEGSSFAPEPISDMEAVETLKSWIDSDLSPHQVILLAQAATKHKELARMQGGLRRDTLLHYCARYGLLPEAKLLLAAGSDAGICNGNGKRPYELSSDAEVQLALLPCEQLIEELRGEFDSGALSPANLQLYAESALAIGLNVSIAGTATGDTLLHLAAAQGNQPLIARLLAAGARVEARNRRGETPAQVAARFNQLAAHRQLVNVWWSPSASGGAAEG